MSTILSSTKSPQDPQIISPLVSSVISLVLLHSGHFLEDIVKFIKEVLF